MKILSPRKFDELMRKLNPRIKIHRYGYPECMYHGYCGQLEYKKQMLTIPNGYVYGKRIFEYTDWFDYHKWYGKKKEEATAHRSLRNIIRYLLDWGAIKPHQIKQL